MFLSLPCVGHGWAHIHTENTSERAKVIFQKKREHTRKTAHEESEGENARERDSLFQQAREKEKEHLRESGSASERERDCV